MVLNVYVKHFFRRHVDNILLGLITTQHKHKNKYTTTNTQLQIHNNKHTQLQIKYTTTNTRQQIKYTTTNIRYKNHNCGFVPGSIASFGKPINPDEYVQAKHQRRFSIDLLNSWILTELETKRTGTSYPVYTIQSVEMCELGSLSTVACRMPVSVSCCLQATIIISDQNSQQTNKKGRAARCQGIRASILSWHIISFTSNMVDQTEKKVPVTNTHFH